MFSTLLLMLDMPPKVCFWLDNDYVVVVESTKESRQRGTRADDEQYKENSREANRVIRIKKRNYERNQWGKTGLPNTKHMLK